VKFWDASAIVPLLIAEASSSGLQALAADDSEMLVWWGSKIECLSAMARLERDTALSARDMTVALERLERLSQAWHEIDPSETVREAAIRFLRVHPLRAADAMQLAAAYLAAERRPASLEIVTLDDRLRTAAHKEGFVVVELPATD
jgi:predicted nucleic acid-binding protein